MITATLKDLKNQKLLKLNNLYENHQIFMPIHNVDYIYF
jgi:hypothetical protein